MQVMATLNRMVALSEINSILSDDKKEPEANKLYTALGSEIGIAHVQVNVCCSVFQRVLQCVLLQCIAGGGGGGG